MPYGQPGDRLWVRETWRPEASKRAVGWELSYPADGARLFADLAVVPHTWRRPKAALTGNVPGIHMPRWASRLTLDVTEVRVQRLQELSEEDAKAEGVQPAPFCKSGRPAGMEHVEAFEDLWQSINGERASWASNPWVWCVSFKLVR